MIKKKLMPLMKQVEHKARVFPFHPNTLTVGGLFFAIVAFVVAIGYQNLLAGFILFLFAFAIDAIDGMVARAKKLQSKKGAFLDGIFDRLVEFLLLVTMWLVFPFGRLEELALLLILFFGTAMTVFVKAYAEHSQMLKHEAALSMPGLLERPERSILLLAIFWLSASGFWQFAIVLLYVTVLLSILTFLQRFAIAYFGKD